MGRKIKEGKTKIVSKAKRVKKKKKQKKGLRFYANSICKWDNNLWLANLEKNHA